MNTRSSLAAMALFLVPFALSSSADVVQSVSNGFQIKVSQKIELDPADSSHAFVHDFNKWWDPSHSYSGEAENLSIDLKQRCFLERLPTDGNEKDGNENGFVRHLEVVYYDPCKSIRFTGGLGPLQQMGVCGALTINFKKDGDTTHLELEYNVSGRLEQGLDKIAPAVDKVISAQMQRYADWCKQRPPAKSEK